MAENILFSHYGEEREINATDEEIEMFSILHGMFEECGGDPNELKLIRRSDSYVTAACGDWDIARFKFTNRAKWITFPTTANDKNRITDPSDITQFRPYCVEFLEVYNKNK